MRVKTQRIDMRIPEQLILKVEEYQEREGISTRTAAFMELVRKGLEAEERKQKDN
ncbi:hypothetical protein [Bacillus sp. LL01]|uniref:hypothetical protein n=1 Tax=Bacillus sp. LL01 TaxID=1665556 RepID=UPI000ACE6CE4|nr:hypothetical protein [Bacillus sp. LL01]